MDNYKGYDNFTTIRELDNLYHHRLTYLHAPDYYKYFYKSADHIIFLRHLGLELLCRAIQGYNTFDFTHTFESEEDVKEFQHYMKMHGYNADITSIRNGNEYHMNINWDLLNRDYLEEVMEANQGFDRSIDYGPLTKENVLNDEAKQEQENSNMV